MVTVEIYRQQAEAARRAAHKARSPSQYLMRLAENYDAQAAALEASYSGDRPTTSRAAPAATNPPVTSAPPATGAGSN
jgi:hypothetical protein